MSAAENSRADLAEADPNKNAPAIKDGEVESAKGRPGRRPGVPLNLRDDQRCVAHSKTGERCKRAPIAGAVVCRAHGGAAPQVKAKARQRLDMAADRLVSSLLGIANDDSLGPHPVRMSAIKEALSRIRELQPGINVAGEMRWEGTLTAGIVEINRADIGGGRVIEAEDFEDDEAYDLPAPPSSSDRALPSTARDAPAPAGRGTGWGPLDEVIEPRASEYEDRTRVARRIDRGGAQGRDGVAIPAGRAEAIARHLGVETVSETVWQQTDGSFIDGAGHTVHPDYSITAEEAARSAGIEFEDPHARPRRDYGPYGGL